MNKHPMDESDNSTNRRISLRDIAAELHISHVTVSKALRNKSGVSKALKVRIQEKADEMGYFPDPLLSALSSYRTTSKTKPIQATLAWLNTWPDPAGLRQYKEFDLYWEGAVNNAQRLGYRLEEFKTSEIPTKRLQTILKTRNIQGILLPPLYDSDPQLDQLNWADFVMVRFGRTTSYPRTHYVTSAQTENTILAFDHCLRLGYQRIGFVCEFWRKRFFGVGYSWAQRNLPQKQQLPLLTLNPSDDFEQQQNDLQKWLHEAKPDAILTDNSETPQMLKNLGYRIPEDIGVATTTIHDTLIDAGIDQRPYEIGRAAIRILTALIAEKSFGAPDCRNEILIEGRWIDGSMLPPR